MSALIDVDQLRTFIAIVETGSFTKAAEVVHKTQSAVSMQMKRLEERLGKPIFARDGRASKLTEDGDRLLDYARRIIKLNVEALAAFDDKELSGRVRLGLPDDYADRYLPEIMARFSRAYPGVELTVLHTPGHSPGACCLHAPELGALFSGDTLFNGGPGATGRSFSDFGTIIDSITSQLLVLPEGTVVHTGHGDDTTIGAEKPHRQRWVDEHED